VNGIVIVDKPSGITSHDVVLFFRRSFRIKKVGHAGTLDPMATGVLVLLLGSATKRSGDFIADDKEYEGTMRFGIRTNTHDKQGKVIRATDISGLTDEEIKAAFDSFLGTINQVPPMVSAVRYKGRKLYELARKGLVVERKPRKVTIYDIKAAEIMLPEVYFTVRCSKGTYIRKLADDIGEKLGCGAHLTSLRRIRSGNFKIGDAVSFDDLKRFDIKMLEDCIKL